MSADATRIARTLYEDIVLGIFPPGTKLIEERLGERFAAKRHVVRAAFAELAALGFVERIPNRGVYVHEMSPREVREIYDVRALLECHAARITPLPAPAAVTDRLTTIQARHGGAIEIGDYRAVLHLNTLFHHVQFAACGNATLVAAIEDYATRVHPITALKFGDEALMAEVAASHRAIIRAMDGTDAEALVAEVRRHFDLRKVEEYARRYRMKYGPADPSPVPRAPLAALPL